MKDWLKLEADETRILNKHFTPGRGGATIEFVTIHHMAMIGGLNECWRVWQDRPASAHYTVDPNGVIGQAVWDRDTAWSNTNLHSNQRSISIEHSNSGGAAQDWPISDKTLEEGAHLTAAICRFYKLGRPTSGKNVRFHSVESGGATGCPWHLRPGHKYHDRYMARAQYWYDQMTQPQPTQTPKLQGKDKPMSELTGISAAALDEAKRAALAAQRNTELIMDQLAGFERDERGWRFTGWQAIRNLTLVNAVGLVLDKLDQVIALLKEKK